MHFFSLYETKKLAGFLVIIGLILLCVFLFSREFVKKTIKCFLKDTIQDMVDIHDNFNWARENRPKKVTCDFFNRKNTSKFNKKMCVRGLHINGWTSQIHSLFLTSLTVVLEMFCSIYKSKRECRNFWQFFSLQLFIVFDREIHFAGPS